MPHARPVSAGQARSRQQQRAANEIAAGGRLQSHPGEHSLWCDLVLVEEGCYPLLARGVVAVLMERKVFLRVAATAFTFTIHLKDVVQVRHVVPKRIVELHVRVVADPPEDGGAAAATAAAPQRLYRLEVTEGAADLAEKFSCAVAAVLPYSASSSLSEPQRRAVHETFTDDAVAAYVGDAPQSLLPLHLLPAAGLQELGWVGNDDDTLTSSAAAVAAPSPPITSAPRDFASASRSPLAVMNGTGMSTGHLRKIYVAPAPAFWRLPPHPIQQQPLRTPPPRPSPTEPTSAHTRRRHRPDAAVEMSSRESSLMAEMCGLRRLTTHTLDPTLSVSRVSHSTDRTLHVQYGPTTSA